MDIKTKHLILGGESGFLGQELGSEEADGKSSFRTYKHGRIYSSPAGVHVLQGAILKKWLELKDDADEADEKFELGYPVSDEREVSDGRGRYSEFEGGVIYWSGSTGAHMVAGSTLSKWRVFGGPRGVLGYPSKDPKGEENHQITEFEKGAIFLDKKGAFVVPGEIYKQWLEKEKGPNAGKLGFPRSDELPQPNSKIRFVKFEKGTLKRTVTSSGIPAGGIESVPQVIEAHDLTLDQIASAHQTHSGTPGFRILSLSIYGSPANPLYACVWVKDGGPAQQVLFKAFKKDLPAILNDLPNNDLHPTIVSATGTAESAVFALVSEKRKGQQPVFRSQLASGPVQVASGPVEGIYDRQTFAFWCQWARGNQHILRCACIYGTADSPVYAGIWELNTSEIPWNVAYHDANKNIATNFLAEQDPILFDEGEMAEITHAQNFWARPSFATRSAHGHQLRVFRADRVVNWVLRENRSLNDYLSDLAEFTPQGFAPVCVQGIRVAGKSRFTVILAKRTQPQPRKLRAKGEKISSLVALDEAMGEMAQSTGARAASLAIAKDGKLVYARAFTWAEADRRDILPTDLFRIASCTKPITSVGVYQLMVDDLLKSEFGRGLAATLTSPLKEHIKLTLPAKSSFAENFNSIKLSQVLAHLGGFRKPVEDEGVVLDAFNKFRPPIKGVKREMPLTMQEFASYMATVKLEAKPGEKPIYSNVGFLFLALVIEQTLGKSYEQALQERIFKKVGVKRPRITESSPNLKDDEVIALDRELRVGRSTVTKERPIVPLEYGTINRDIHPGSGGWVLAPADYVRFLSVLHLGSDTLLPKELVEMAATVKVNGHSIKKHGGGIVGAVAHIEHMKHKDSEFTFAVFFAINFLGDYETRIRDIIKALPEDAWPPDDDLFPSVGIL